MNHVYFKVTGNKMVIVALYVDDFLIFSNDLKEKSKLIKMLKNKFKIKDLGEVKQFLDFQLNARRQEKHSSIRSNI